MPYVRNYLVESILAAIFCCQIPGIVAIVYAAQVNSMLISGNYDAAVECSNKARAWLVAAVLLAIGPWILGILMILGGAFAHQ